LLALLAVVSVLIVGAEAAAAASPGQESDLGRRFSLEARAVLPLVDDVEVNRYVDRLGQSIVSALADRQFDYHFATVRDPQLNAFAVPGGYIYVHAGLLNQVSNDDELAGVLGHEVAHVHKHHLARQQEATKLFNYTALLGVLAAIVQPALGAGAIALSEAAKLEYRREFEQEADYLGSRYMQQAGYDVRGMLDFFKKMMDAQRSRPSQVPPYLLSHPLSEARLTNLEAVSGKQQWDRGAPPSASLELERVQLLLRVRSRMPQDAVALYRRRAESQPENAVTHYLLGLVRLETGALQEARRSFEKARTLGMVSVDRDLGRTYLRQRRPEKARVHLQHAVEIDPGDPVAQRELGKTLEIQGEREAAMQAYKRALRLFPEQADVHHSLGMLAGRAGREADGFYHLAMASFYRGEYKKALGHFEKAAPLLPEDDPRAAQVAAAITELKPFTRLR
jgi:predicted Zn-dependent protease